MPKFVGDSAADPEQAYAVRTGNRSPRVSDAPLPPCPQSLSSCPQAPLPKGEKRCIGARVLGLPHPAATQKFAPSRETTRARLRPLPILSGIPRGSHIGRALLDSHPLAGIAEPTSFCRYPGRPQPGKGVPEASRLAKYRPSL